MSATTLETPETSVRDGARSTTDRPTRSRPQRTRPAGRSGRVLAPRSRPAHPVAAPSLAPARSPQVRACQADPVALVAPLPSPVSIKTRTRLTDRGIAVILVTGAMIVLAAVTVVGLTAVRVTSDSYQPLTSTQLVQP